jgi:peptide/nickel transport system permease protein
VIAYVLRRLALAVPVVLLVGTITFVLMQLTPGDPAAVMLGPEATPDQVAELREQMGLNRPLYERYPRWLFDTLRLDLGQSIFLNKPVSAAITERLMPTLQLTLYALIIAIAIGVPAGVVAAMNRNTIIDRALMLFAMSGTAIAGFFLGILLILLFAVRLKWLPSGGYAALTDDPARHFKSMIMPAMAVGLSVAGLPARLVRSTMLDVLHEDYIRTAVAKGLPPRRVAIRHALRNAMLPARLVRSTMLDVLHEDYIRTAVAKGLPPRRVAIRHALRNAMLPAITVFGYTLGDLLGGAVVVETVFSLPGMGQLVVNSIARRDFPVIQGVVMTIAIFYMLTSLLVDILYVALDPRVKHVGR